MHKIRLSNLERCETGSYPDFAPLHPHYRFDLRMYDHGTLYRLLNARIGIDTTNEVAHNLEGWLDPDSLDYRPELANAVFYYRARTVEAERIKLCIATPAMDAAAWEHGHLSQTILDGTFGITNARMLLFIMMVVDKDWKGIPVAFFLFSAPPNSKFTPAGYDTSILVDVLQEWRDHLTSQHPSTPFRPLVCMTDTDAKERGALLLVWPTILLLLCRFHVRQCWTNHRKQVFMGSLKWKENQGGVAMVKARLQALEVS